jgi:hypothetical protein
MYRFVQNTRGRQIHSTDYLASHQIPVLRHRHHHLALLTMSSGPSLHTLLLLLLQAVTGESFESCRALLTMSHFDFNRAIELFLRGSSSKNVYSFEL